MLWVDPTDPSVVAAVAEIEPASGVEDPDVQLAVAIASEVLTLATGFLIHPAGEQTEEFIGRGIRRLAPLYGPLTGVTALVTVAADDTERPVTGWRRVGNVLILPGNQRSSSTPLWRTNGACEAGDTVYRLTYRFGSTVTWAARQALLDYARQLYLALEDSDDCQLPERVTSIDREGIGIQLATPQDFLDRGRTGLPKVDTWLSQANPKRALRPSAVYTPDSPPGVGVRMRRL